MNGFEVKNVRIDRQSQLTPLLQAEKGFPPFFIASEAFTKPIQIYLESWPCSGLILLEPMAFSANERQPMIENFNESRIPLLICSQGHSDAAKEVHNRLGGEWIEDLETENWEQLLDWVDIYAK